MRQLARLCANQSQRSTHEGRPHMLQSGSSKRGAVEDCGWGEGGI